MTRQDFMGEVMFELRLEGYLGLFQVSKLVEGIPEAKKGMREHFLSGYTPQ